MHLLDRIVAPLAAWILAVISALGYGGNGITFSMIAARLITDLILQRPNDDAAVFRFDR